MDPSVIARDPGISPVVTIAEICGVFLLAAASPGPNFVLITRTAAADSRRAGLMVAGGVATGSGLLAMAAALGLGVVLREAAWLESGLRLIGGYWLAYLGTRMWREAHRSVTDTTSAGTGWTAYRRGLLSNVTNPKSAIFFGSILSGLLPGSAPVWERVTAVTAIVVCSALWNGCLAVGFSTTRAQHTYARIKPVMDRSIGAILVVLGISLAADVAP